MTHDDVRRWVASYVKAWRSPGTEALSVVFSEQVSYRPAPWADAVEGLPALAEFWEGERDGPDESFAMTSEVVAVEDGTAVVRVQIDYVRADAGSWRDLWVLRLDPDGRCSHFEEWPFAPAQLTGH
jgi:hypothetical protein